MVKPRLIIFNTFLLVSVFDAFSNSTAVSLLSVVTMLLAAFSLIVGSLLNNYMRAIAVRSNERILLLVLIFLISFLDRLIACSGLKMLVVA